MTTTAIAADELVIVTADKIADTGTVNWQFLFELPRDVQNQVLRHPFGYAWSPREGDVAFSVFEAGKGLLIAGGWTDDDDADWQRKVLSDIPGCVLLMRTETFEWLRDKALAPNGRTFQRHHVDKILATS